VAEEGCLSFPGIYVKIGRFARVVARYQDLQGRPRRLEAEGLLARAVQHEIDHLDGRLLVDRMSVVQRMAHRRRLRELERRARQDAAHV
jgi:peptide deformylase